MVPAMGPVESETMEMTDIASSSQRFQPISKFMSENHFENE